MPVPDTIFVSPARSASTLLTNTFLVFSVSKSLNCVWYITLRLWIRLEKVCLTDWSMCICASSTARQRLVLACPTGCRRNKADLHTVTAPSSSSGSDWSLNWQNNACVGRNNSGVSTVTCCVSWWEQFRFRSSSPSSSSSPGRLKSSNLKTGCYRTARSPAATGIQSDLFHLQMDTMPPARLLRKKPLSADKPQRGRRRIKSQLRLRLCWTSPNLQLLIQPN